MTDRLCDLDGDGTGDNGLADLGSPTADIFAMTLNTNIHGLIAERNTRILFYFPWLDDAVAPADDMAGLAVFRAVASDWPADAAEDFEGRSSFYPWHQELDPCNEPLYFLRRAAIHDGEVEATEGDVPVPTMAVARGASLVGTIAPRGEDALFEVCGTVLIRELGDIHTIVNASGLSSLEALLAGGAAFGLDSVPGLAPDVDVDGDGLERIELDADLHVASCVDGDSTAIEGGDCWRDERMADGFSMNLRITAVGAELAGLHSYIPVALQNEECPDPMSTSSLWGACSEPSVSLCSAGDLLTGEDSCGHPGENSCDWDCLGWRRPIPSGITAVTFESCADLELSGSASCSSAASGLVIVDSAGQVGGARLVEPVTVGSGPLVATATVISLCPFGASSPGDGVALVVAAQPGAEWLGTAGGEDLGINRLHRGYSAQWRHCPSGEPDGCEIDALSMSILDGSGIPWAEAGPLCGPRGCQWSSSWGLDCQSFSRTEHWLRLVIVPDDPETPENELVVASEDRVYDATIEDYVWMPTFLWCAGDGCAVPISSGDEVVVGLTGASTSGPLAVTVPAGELTVTASGICD